MVLPFTDLSQVVKNFVSHTLLDIFVEPDHRLDDLHRQSVFLPDPGLCFGTFGKEGDIVARAGV
jgi:hypothetical protein